MTLMDPLIQCMYASSGVLSFIPHDQADMFAPTNSTDAWLLRASHAP